MKKLVQISGFLLLSIFASIAQADLITCSSTGYKYNSCSTNGYVTRVILRQQISKSACTYGQSWGFDSQTIWVDKGCRGTFETISNNGYPPPGNGHNPPPDYGNPPPDYGHNPGYPPPPPLDQQEQIQCGSYGYSLNYCYPAAQGRIVYIRLLRQLSLRHQSHPGGQRLRRPGRRVRQRRRQRRNPERERSRSRRRPDRERDRSAAR